MKIQLHDDKRENSFGSGWWRSVTITKDDGAGREIETVFRVGVYSDGKPRKIAYRGGARGFWWYADVMSEGRLVWTGRVSKSIGVRGILKAAEIIE